MLTVRTVTAALTGLAICFGSMQATTMPAEAAPACSAPALKKGQTPVLLAHGLGSSAATWTGNNGAAMVAKLKPIKGLYIETFDYSLKHKNLTWVTDPQIANRFAERITCLNKLSGEKVIAGGHSMGGLLIREAANTVGSKIGFIFTMGTPNTGSGWANIGTNLLRAFCPLGAINDNSICDVDAMRGLRNGSDEINRLPKHNGTIPLLAVAGDVTLELELGFTTIHKDTDSDLVVSKQSALQYDAHQEQGGGQKVVQCSGPGPWDIACQHTRLPHNSEATQDVVDAIKKYLSYRDEQRRIAAEQAKLADALKPFIGKWRVHGSTLYIRKDGSGTYDWNNGACYDTGTSPNCSAFMNVHFVLKDGLLHGTFVGEPWFKPWEDNAQVLQNYEPPQPLSLTAGESFGVFTVHTPGVLKDISMDPNEGNPYLCDTTRASDTWRNQCNA